MAYEAYFRETNRLVALAAGLHVVVRFSIMAYEIYFSMLAYED